MKERFVVSIARDPAAVEYDPKRKPDLLITPNRIETKVPTIALNDFLAEHGRRILEMYDTDLMAVLADPDKRNEMGAHIPDDVVEHLRSFRDKVFTYIADQAGDKEVVIKPYYAAHTQHFTERGFTVEGPSHELTQEHSQKTATWELAGKLHIPRPEGKVHVYKEQIGTLLKEFGGDIFVADEDDPFYPDNRRITQSEQIEALDERKTYLVTRWEQGTLRSPNTQVLIGERDVLFLGQTDQTISGVAHGGNTFPSQSPEKIQKRLESLTRIMANKMQEDGYRGVAGFDWIETNTGKVYFIETNPRTNRSTALLFSVIKMTHPEISISELEEAVLNNQSYPNSTESTALEGVILHSYSWKPSSSFIMPSLEACGLVSITEYEVLQQAHDKQETVVSVINAPVAGTHIEPHSPSVIRIVAAGPTQEEVQEALEKTIRILERKSDD